MSNEVKCILVITGDPDAVGACLAAMRSPESEDEDQRLFDFERVIPLPPDLRAQEAPPGASGEEAVRWAWRAASVWGTKWNAYGVTIDDQPDGGARIRFFTAGAPPRPVIETLAEKFPSLGFDLTYSDEQMPVAGRLRRAQGDQVWATLKARHDYGFCDAVLAAESRDAFE